MFKIIKGVDFNAEFAMLTMLVSTSVGAILLYGTESSGGYSSFIHGIFNIAGTSDIRRLSAGSEPTISTDNKY